MFLTKPLYVNFVAAIHVKSVLAGNWLIRFSVLVYQQYVHRHHLRNYIKARSQLQSSSISSIHFSYLALHRGWFITFLSEYGCFGVKSRKLCRYS